MRTTSSIRQGVSAPGIAALLMMASLLAGSAEAANMKVLRMGLGSGTITSSPSGINCGTDCDEAFGNVSVTLTATPAPGSTFAGWAVDADADTTTTPDCNGTSTTCTVSLGVDRSVRPVFDLSPAIPTLASFTPEGIASFLSSNPTVNTPARFLKALPAEYKINWILMSRSESLQTGTAEMPRILLPSANAQRVFTVGMATHSSYPGAHPNAIEYMQWDAAQKNFRFHEIILDDIPQMGPLAARTRGVVIDDQKCFKCHSTRNVLNPTSTPGTTGVVPGTLKAKSKPNWDSYDSWGGMLPFNRDRIYQGSVEAASFRKLFNPWTWRTNDAVRSIIEQLKLQPSNVAAVESITRRRGGANDGHIRYAFDTAPPVLIEPLPSGTSTAMSSYSFGSTNRTDRATAVVRGGQFVHLRHSGDATSTGVDVEGRGTQLFDLLGGLDGNLNPQRIADELIDHRFATGGVPIDVRPIALAIAKRCFTISGSNITSSPALTVDLSFFNSRNGMTINQLVLDSRNRALSMPRRKVDIQKINLHRTGDPYLSNITNGLIPQYGAATTVGTGITRDRLRQEVFRRPIDLGAPDGTDMDGLFVDRESYTFNVNRIALYRYFLEPLGVSVDKWSMGVRGRQRTYTFADVFSTYENVLEPQLAASLGLSTSATCAQVIPLVNSSLASANLPPVNAVPPYTDVQRIFNKSCIECHGGLEYPPYANYGSGLDLSEEENPPGGFDRMDRSHQIASGYITNDPATSQLYQRITMTNEDCPFGLMPCGGPPLSKVDVETIRRWIAGAAPNTRGDPHIKTVDGISYDFPAAGEFVLLHGQNLEIQVRQTPIATGAPLKASLHTGLASCASLNSAVAIRVGRNRITYQPNLSGLPDPEGLQLRIDGRLEDLDAGEIRLPSGGRIVPATVPGGFQVEAPGGTVIVVTSNWSDHHQLWYMNVDVRHARATEGLMGSIAPGNWLPALPDGSFMGPKPANLRQRYADLHEKFGNAWRVSAESSLFDYAPGTSTATFTLASWPQGESPLSCIPPGEPGDRLARPPLPTLAQEVAERHCGALVGDETRANCIHDVMSTGEPGLARLYERSEQIALNKTPTAPALVSPVGFETGLAAPVSFTWNAATDRDGDSLTYKHCVWNARERFTFDNCSTVEQSSWRNGALVALLGCLLPAVLIAAKKRPRGTGLVAVAVLVLVSLGLACSGRKPMTTDRVQVNGKSVTFNRTVSNLEPGKAYFWKVIAEDGKGGTVESETRRFEIK